MAFALDRREEMLDAWRKLTAIEPENDDEHVARGRAFARLDEPEKALPDYNQAIEPGRLAGFTSLGHSVQDVLGLSSLE